MVRLENIRNRSGLLLVVIGIAMLAFILTDLMSSSNGAVSTDFVIGEVGDEEIDYQAFEQRVQQALKEQRASNPSVNEDQVRNSVWSQIVRETILSNQYNNLGLEVSPSELFDMVQGDNPYPSIVKSFKTDMDNLIERDLLQYLKKT